MNRCVQGCSLLGDEGQGEGVREECVEEELLSEGEALSLPKGLRV